MLFTPKERLEDKIIRSLLEREQTAKELFMQLSSPEESYTIQALYTALRNLMQEEVVLKNRALYSLNEEWRYKVVMALEKEKLPHLADGESVTYTLSSLAHYDLQWKNIILPLHRAYPRDPIFFYSYHYIWVHLGKSRRESEQAYFAQLRDQKIPTFSLTGSDSQHDRAVKQELQNEYVRWAVGVEQFSRTDYVTVFHDYIITTRLPKIVAELIEGCYQNSADSDQLAERLQGLHLEKKKMRLIIERNQTKAKAVRRRLAREFFVSKELIEEFKLF